MSESVDSDPTQADLSGAVIAGRYHVQRRIGAGGMGVLYLARDASLGRSVVLKVMSPQRANDRDARSRFEREARALSQLNHPNVVTIHDYGEEGDLLYLVMEHLRGETLSERIRRSGAMSFEAFLPIMIQIVEGVAAAHRQGVVHRDLKPSNIMITDTSGRPNLVKVVDFGLSRTFTEGRETSKENQVVGTAAYLAPEVINGKQADEKSDVYALGVMFFHALSGQRPFEGEDDVTVLYKHLHEDPPTLDNLIVDGDIPEVIETLIDDCMSKEPLFRPTDAAQVLKILAPFAGVNLGVAGEFDAAYEVRELPSGAFEAAIAPTTDSSLSALNEQVAQLSSRLATQHKTRRTQVLVLALLLITVVGAALGFVLTREPAAPAPSVDATADLVGVLDEVEALATAHKFGQAETLLGKVDDQLANHPDLLSRAAELEDITIIGRLLVTGSQDEERGDKDAAIVSYKAVLDRNPENEAALAALTRLTTPDEEPAAVAARPAPRGKLTVNSTPSGNVFVDDRPMGTSPLTQRISLGTHRIEVRVRDYQAWETTIEVAEGDHLVLEPTLEPDEKVSRVAKASRKTRTKKKRSSASKPSTPPEVEDDDSASEPVPEFAEAEESDSEEPTSPIAPAATARVAEPTKPPAVEHTAPATSPRPKKAAPAPIAKPALPSIAWIRNVQNLKSALQAIEQEVIAKNGFDPGDVRNTTVLLFKEINQQLAPGANLKLNPRKVYYVIAERVRDGKSRGSTAQLLVSKYRAGKL